MTKPFLFISEENWLGFQNKNNRKNKSKYIYTWKLERFFPIQQLGIELDVFPSSSEKKGIQLVKVEILNELNSRNVFDFNYQPASNDFLSIVNQKDKDEYLRLVFINGHWEEEEFLNTIRNIFEKYIELKSGFLEL